MNKIVLLFSCILFFSCISRNNEKYVSNESTVILKAKFFKIETKNGIHIYHFKNDSIEGVFSEAIRDNFINVNFKEIRLHKKYTLVLTKEIFSGKRRFEVIIDKYIDNDVIIWRSGMKSKYFTSCKNIVGNKINPRFTLIKYIYPNFENKMTN